jgi:putative transcription antitermination factor YqgF
VDFGFSSEQDMLRRTVREFAEGEIAPTVMHFDETQEFPRELVRKAAELEAKGFVLGLPRDEEDNDTEWTTQVRALGAELAKRTGLPVRFLDESFTTTDALAAVREVGGKTRGRKGDVDSLAAAVLLQRALDEPD